MARRAHAAPIHTKRLEAEGEWVEIKTTVPYGEFIKFQSQAATADKETKEEGDDNHRMVAMFVSSWSFVGEDGQPLPVTFENVKDNADAPVLTDAFLEIVGSDFLDKMSRLRRAGS